MESISNNYVHINSFNVNRFNIQIFFNTKGGITKSK